MMKSISIVIVLIALISISFIHAEDTQTQSKLVNEFKELALKHGGVIPFTMPLVKKYLTGIKNRPYDFIGLFSSSDPKHGCVVCESAKSELISYKESYMAYLNSPDFDKRPLFLGIIEVNQCMEIFNTLSLQTIPHLIYFPVGDQPISGKQRVEQVDRKVISNFILKNIGVKIEVITPVQEKVLFVVYIVGGLIIGYRFIKFVWNRRKNPMIYFIGTMLLFSLVIGGIFYDAIHRPPLMEYNYQAKQYSYFSRGPRSQTISEGLIMGALVVVTSLIYIFITKLPETSFSQNKTSIGLLSICLLCLLLACLNRGYQMKYYKSWFDYPMLKSTQ